MEPVSECLYIRNYHTFVGTHLRVVSGNATYTCIDINEEPNEYIFTFAREGRVGIYYNITINRNGLWDRYDSKVYFEIAKSGAKFISAEWFTVENAKKTFTDILKNIA